MGFVLPTIDSPRNRTAELKPEGLFTKANRSVPKGETVPYENIMKLVMSDRDVEIVFRDDVVDPETQQAPRKPMILNIMEGSSHQLIDLEKFIEGYILQQNRGKMDDNGDRILGIIVQAAKEGVEEKTVPWIEFDTDRVQNRLDQAFAFS